MATLNIKEYLDRDEQKDLLRFLTAGSVDDGKSTLIGLATGELAPHLVRKLVTDDKDAYAASCKMPS